MVGRVYKICGTLIIDKGAEKALFNGASILPRGVKKISGKFSKGDIINIKNNLGKKIGKGITFYDSIELKFDDWEEDLGDKKYIRL